MIRAVTHRNTSTVWQLNVAGLWLEFPTWFAAEAMRRRLA